MTTTTTLIVQGHGFVYKATLNDELIVDDAFDPAEGGLHVYPLSGLMLEGENTIRVGGTPQAPGAQLHVVLGSKQIGTKPRALLENTFSESFGVSTTVDLAPGGGLPRAAVLGADTQHARGPVMDLHQAVANRDAEQISALLARAAQFWSERDDTEPTWGGSDYLGHLKRFVENPNYELRPLANISFRPGAGGRLQIPTQEGRSVITFEHREDPEATFQFDVALAPSSEGWVFVR